MIRARSIVRSQTFSAGALLVLAARAAAQGIELAGTRFLPAGAEPYGVACADLDRDGRVDLVSTNSADDTVSVMLGIGRGRFAPRSVFACGNGPLAVATGDLDGDGRVDVVTANDLDDTLSVLRNQGGGSFAAPIPLAAGSHPASVAIGDLDGDGDLDLVAANFFGDTISVFVNFGAGAFAPQTSYSVGDGPIALALADHDGDGDLDVATANYNAGKIATLANRGDGTFKPAVAFSTGGNPAAIAAGDVTGDGAPDLVVATRADGLVHAHRNAGGSFVPHGSFPSWGSEPQSIALGDLDGDGDRDVVATFAFGEYEYPSACSYLNAGDGTFGPATPYAFGFATRALATPDLDEDGDLDLVAAVQSSGMVATLWNDGHGDLGGRETVSSLVWSIASADFDGDGALDLAGVGATSTTSHVWVRRGRGDGVFDAETSYAVGHDPRHVLAVDMDGDGAKDLVVGVYGMQAVVVLRNLGDGTFAPLSSLPVAQPISLAAADLDHDGDEDLVVAQYHGSHPSIRVLRNTGSGTLVMQPLSVGGAYAYGLTVADLDGDGFADLAAPHFLANQVLVARNHGDGTFEPATGYAVALRPRRVTAADLDGDGDLDLAACGDEPAAPPGFSMLRNAGNGTFGPYAFVPSPSGLAALVAGDLDDDGDLDVVLAAPRTGLSVQENDGSGTFGPARAFMAGNRCTDALLADFDADGDLDVATADHGSSTVSILRNERVCGVAFCSGDGTSGPCPCGNAGAPGHGCASSIFAAGAELTGAGVASVARDTVTLRATNVTGPMCFFFQGEASKPPAFVDDGLGCVGGSILRVGAKPVAASASSVPAIDDPRVSTRGQVPPAGATRAYQAFYRDPASAFCTPASSNRTNGYAVTWTP